MITWSTFIFTQGLMVDPIQVVEILQKDSSLYMHLFRILDGHCKMDIKNVIQDFSAHSTKLQPSEISTLYWPNFQFKGND